MSARDKYTATGAGAPRFTARIDSLVAQLWALEMHRQMRGSPDPLFLLDPVEEVLSKAAERGEGLGSAEVRQLLAALAAHCRMCKAQLKRHSREGGLWRELLDFLKNGRQ